MLMLLLEYPPEAFEIYINDDLKNLLRNFNMTYAYDNFGLNWNLLVSNKLSNNQTINSVLYYVESQSYSSLSTVFSPVSSIVFMSNMGILTEYIGQLQILNNNSITTNQSNNIENQIMDNTTHFNGLFDVNFKLDKAIITKRGIAHPDNTSVADRYMLYLHYNLN